MNTEAKTMEQLKQELVEMLNSLDAEEILFLHTFTKRAFAYVLEGREDE